MGKLARSDLVSNSKFYQQSNTILAGIDKGEDLSKIL